jgi:hypothetical protein
VWYSESCAALLGVTPSSGDSARKDPDIVTTDLMKGGLETVSATCYLTSVLTCNRDNVRANSREHLHRVQWLRELLH